MIAFFQQFLVEHHGGKGCFLFVFGGGGGGGGGGGLKAVRDLEPRLTNET